MGYFPFFLVYRSKAILPTDLAFGTPRIQHYEEGIAEETRKVDLDNVEEHNVVALMRHTRQEQQLCHYNDRNVWEQSFNVSAWTCDASRTPRTCTSSLLHGNTRS
jgi:hypothetical protein